MLKVHPGILKNSSDYKAFWDALYSKGVQDNKYELCDIKRFLKEVRDNLLTDKWLNATAPLRPAV